MVTRGTGVNKVRPAFANTKPSIASVAAAFGGMGATTPTGAAATMLAVATSRPARDVAQRRAETTALLSDTGVIGCSMERLAKSGCRSLLLLFYVPTQEFPLEIQFIQDRL